VNAAGHDDASDQVPSGLLLITFGVRPVVDWPYPKTLTGWSTK